MMRGPTAMALAVRDENGNICIESERHASNSKGIAKIPVIRGMVNFVVTMILSVKTLLKSAEVGGGEDEQLGNGGVFLAVFLGIGFFVVLFMLLPGWIYDLIVFLTKQPMSVLVKSLTEGGIRMAIFISYLALVRLMRDIKRTYMYHGAEHKVINCYERKKELTVENARACPKAHDRCGTTFLFIVMVVSILVFSLAYWGADALNVPDKAWIRALIRIGLLPFVAGFSYEILRGLAKAPDIWFFRALKAPGLLLQKLTTCEPDDSMIEVAIAAFNETDRLEKDSAKETVRFVMPFSKAYESINKRLADKGIDSADCDWIFCDVLKVNRSELKILETIPRKAYNECAQIAKARAEGKPLAYILGYREFYGLRIKVNPHVLIPRMETELLAEQCIKNTKEGARILDLCTGSGCIAAAVLANSGARVTASDIDQNAINVAKENARGAEFIRSDMFKSIPGEFDIIVCNPPYVPTTDILTLSVDVRQEPTAALDGGTDGLKFYRILAEEAAGHLSDDGILLLEVGVCQARTVSEMLKGRFDVTIMQDYSGIDRIIMARRIK